MSLLGMGFLSWPNCDLMFLDKGFSTIKFDM